MGFNNYKKYITYEKKEVNMSVKKYVIRVEIASPRIESFKQDVVEGRIYKEEFISGKKFDYENDILDVIEKKEKKIKEKAKAKFTFLELIDTSIILGIEISEEYDRPRIARFIGNFFSKPLFHDKQWALLTSENTHLFRIREFKEYKE